MKRVSGISETITVAWTEFFVNSACVVLNDGKALWGTCLLPPGSDFREFPVLIGILDDAFELKVEGLHCAIKCINRSL
jgi:hypothetical protein